MVRSVRSAVMKRNNPRAGSKKSIAAASKKSNAKGDGSDDEYEVGKPIRCLVATLLQKEWKADPTVEEVIIQKNMDEIAELALLLIDDPEKTPALTALAQLPFKDIVKMKAVRKRGAQKISQLNDSTDFDPEVTRFDQIPDIWSWQLNVDLATVEIDPAIMNQTSGKSQKVHTQGMTYLSGIPGDYPICAKLRVMATMSAFIKACMADKKDRLNKGQKGFWNECVVGQRLVMNGKPHGVFSFDGPQEADKATFVQHNLSEVKIELKDKKFQIDKDIEIYDNFNEYAAYIIVLDDKKFIHKWFGNKLGSRSQEEELAPIKTKVLTELAQRNTEHQIVISEDVAQHAKRVRRQTAPKAAPKRAAAI